MNISNPAEWEGNRIKHHGILVSVLLFSATGIFAQEDVRVASTVTELEGGLFEIVVVNEASEAMTAFMVVVEGLGSSPGRNPIRVHYCDSVRYSHRDRPILRGGSWKLTRGAIAPRTEVSLKAAIFENGSSFGDPLWVERILDMRRLSMEAIDTSLRRLRAGLESGDTREQLVQDFDKLLAASREGPREAHSREERWARGEIFDTVLDNLKDAKRTEDGTVPPVEEVIRLVMDNMVNLHQRLLVSKPSLAAPVSR